MSNGFIYVVDAHAIDKIEEKKSRTQVPVVNSYNHFHYVFICTYSLYKDLSTSQRFIKNESRNETKIFVKS